jgi:hypothetical protein
MRRMVGGCATVKKRAGDNRLNFLSGVPLQRLVGGDGLTFWALEIKGARGSGDFVKNFTIELASGGKAGLR